MDSTFGHFIQNNTCAHTNIAFEVPKGNHAMPSFSLSKAFSLAGYRVGYLAISINQAGTYQQWLKVQDIIHICVLRMSQHAVLVVLSSDKHGFKPMLIPFLVDAYPSFANILRHGKHEWSTLWKSFSITLIKSFIVGYYYQEYFTARLVIYSKGTIDWY